jgi:hypothetical protein
MQFSTLFSALALSSSLVLATPEPQNYQQFQSDLVNYLTSIAQDPAFMSFEQAIATEDPAIFASLQQINPATITNVNQIIDALPTAFRSIYGQVISAELSIASKDGIILGNGGFATETGGLGGGSVTSTAGANTITGATTMATAASGSSGTDSGAANTGTTGGTAASTTKSGMASQATGLVMGAAAAAVAGLAILL